MAEAYCPFKNGICEGRMCALAICIPHCYNTVTKETKDLYYCGLVADKGLNRKVIDEK